jgi:two-component system chemotaxis response regulator CheY
MAIILLWLREVTHMETDENIGKRILLVEDERVARELIRDLLKQNDHVVVEANNGAEAYSLFTKGKFDLVMTDYIMPFVNGDELASRIKQLAPKQPILMVTAHDFKRRASSPVNAVLQKPFDSFLLQQEIDKLV